MSDTIRALVTVSALCLVASLGPDLSLAQTTFASNYDVILTVGDAQYRAQSRVRVADGSTIPIEFTRFRVNLNVSSIDSERFQVLLTIDERIDREWIRLDVDPEGFGGAFGAPLRFAWNGNSVRLNIAFIASIDRQ